MDSLASQIIIDILTQEMCLDPETIWIRDQNRKIPDDKTLFLIVGLVNAPTVLCNTTSVTYATVNAEVVMTETNQVQQREEIMIDVFSRNNEALRRNWEVTAALQSIYAQQQQEKNNFKIFRQPISIANTSGAEGGSNINRFSITVAAFVWYKKDKSRKSLLGDYYDDFTTRVDDSNTIGTDNPIAEFEITPDSPPPIP